VGGVGGGGGGGGRGAGGEGGGGGWCACWRISVICMSWMKQILHLRSGLPYQRAETNQLRENNPVRPHGSAAGVECSTLGP